MRMPKTGKWIDVSFSVGEYHGDTEDTKNIEITITSGRCSECGRFSENLMQYRAKMPVYCCHCGSKNGDEEDG